MPIADYHRAILNLRSVPLKRTREVEQRLDTALRLAHAELETLIGQAVDNDLKSRLNRQQYEVRRQRIRQLINDLAVSLKRDLVDAQRAVIDDVVLVRSDETTALLREMDIAAIADFTQVPVRVLDELAQRIDIDGLKLSAQIWADTQMGRIETLILAGIARGQSAHDLSVALKAFVLGSDALMPEEKRLVKPSVIGHSVATKAKRLARTEINNAYWEAGRRSADLSPVVGGIQWNLSNRHPQWDVCDIFADQDLFGIGAGVYPPSQLPPKPHPNDLCFQTDVLRDVREWDTPKPTPAIQVRPDSVTVDDAVGTTRFIDNQITLFTDLMVSTIERT